MKLEGGVSRCWDVWVFECLSLSEWKPKLFKRWAIRERKHPFTTFANRAGFLSCCNGPANEGANLLQVNGHGQLQVNVVSQDMQTQDTTWDRGFLCRVYTHKRAHTGKIAMSAGGTGFAYQHVKLDTWFLDASNSIPHLMRAGKRVCLIGGGSGCAYLLDAICYFKANRTRFAQVEDAGRKVVALKVIFNSNDVSLMQWFTNAVNALVDDGIKGDVEVLVHLTGGNGKAHPVENFDKIDFEWGHVACGRAVFAEEMQDLALAGEVETHVFCQGSAGLQKTAKSAAKEYKFTFHGAPSFDNAKGKNKKDGGKKEPEVEDMIHMQGRDETESESMESDKDEASV